MLRHLLVIGLAPLLAAAEASAQTESVTFSRRVAEVGDRVEQSVAVEFNLKTSTRRGAEVLDQAQTQIVREQRRLITTTGVGQTGAHSARVEFRTAQRAFNGGEPERDPVVGNTYQCTRRGETLEVTRPDGTMPTLREFEIVSRSMEALGRENPLARFLDGRTVRVGERIELPSELAAELLGFEEQLAATKRFTLTLQEVRQPEGRPVAVFQAEIEAGSGETGQMGLIVSGPFALQVNGCRAESAELAGPIGISESQASPQGGTVQLTAVGKLRLAIRTRYADAR